MSVFGLIKSDDKVFTGDKLRIDARGSFLAPGLSFKTGAASFEVSLNGGVDWYDITTPKYADWIFTTPGTKTIQLRLTLSDDSTHIFTKSIECLDLVDQRLFSKDSDLYGYESEIDQYLPQKWSSWNLVHLKAQEWIIDWLDEKRIFNEKGEKYTPQDLLDIEQVKQLSCAKVLELIYESNINIVGDLFTQKRDKYAAMVADKAAKSQIALDFNDNGQADEFERTDLMAVAVRRG